MLNRKNIFCIMQEEKHTDDVFLLECYFNEDRAHEEAQKYADDYEEQNYYVESTHIVIEKGEE